MPVSQNLVSLRSLVTNALQGQRPHCGVARARRPIPGSVPASNQVDIFAFGMVIVEVRIIFCCHPNRNIGLLSCRHVVSRQVFAGTVPFQTSISTAVAYMVMSGQRPPRPRGVEKLGLSDILWRMKECCWPPSPKECSKASEVVDLLQEILRGMWVE